MNWQTQSSDKPLFPDLLWSRPENKNQAGKLLIIGGQAQEFANVAACYQAALSAGAGSVKVIMPKSLEKLAGAMPDVQFAPATQIGSFAKNALAELLDAADWADAVLLAGDTGKNSETTAMLDSFLGKNNKLTIISDNALESISLGLESLVDKPVDLILSFKHLQKLGSRLKLQNAFTSTMGNNVFAQMLSQISKDHQANIVIQNEGQAWVASQGRVTNTKLNANINELAAYSAVWHMQNPNKPLESLATATFQVQY